MSSVTTPLLTILLELTNCNGDHVRNHFVIALQRILEVVRTEFDLLQAEADLTKANAIEFSVRDEPWIKHKLEGGTLLFGRLAYSDIRAFRNGLPQ